MELGEAKTEFPLDTYGRRRVLGYILRFCFFLFSRFLHHGSVYNIYYPVMSIKKAISLDSHFDFPRTLQQDREHLQKVKVPIITTSASFKSDIARNFGEPSQEEGHDIVFSRGHFSMSVALFEQAHEMHLSTWLIDPTNYVSKKDWGKLKEVVLAGRIVARFPLIKHIKDLVDTVIRGKLPISQAITEPLLFATAGTTKPIVSVHYEAGNILVREGHVVLQVVTDPHVRPQYIQEAERKNMHFAVFNTQTRDELFKKAQEEGKTIDSERIVVTGPPVDPRVVRARKSKSSQSLKKRALRLAITTGGLGQNKEEILDLLQSIGPEIKEGKIQVVLYASTLPDFRDMYEDIVKRYAVPLGSDITDQEAPARILYSSSIVDANNMLIEHAFSWADGFITKPSGDMAYDAVGAGCFLLGLEPWGDWEGNVEQIFSDLSILKRVEPKRLKDQLNELRETGWITQAINNALGIDKLFLVGARNIVKFQQKLSKERA